MNYNHLYFKASFLFSIRQVLKKVDNFWFPATSLAWKITKMIVLYFSNIKSSIRHIVTVLAKSAQPFPEINQNRQKINQNCHLGTSTLFLIFVYCSAMMQLTMRLCLVNTDRYTNNLRLKSFVFQIGPGLVRLRMQTPIGPFLFSQSVTPIGPLLQKVTHRLYSPTYNAFAAYPLILSEGKMVRMTNNIS